jgi:hypothetical protein
MPRFFKVGLKTRLKLGALIQTGGAFCLSAPRWDLERLIQLRLSGHLKEVAIHQNHCLLDLARRRLWFSKTRLMQERCSALVQVSVLRTRRPVSIIQ